jgi:xanthine dehydrogenase accessory factor
MNNIYLMISDIVYASRAVIATVTGTQGSTPRKEGSSAVFGEKGLMCGTIGGGVLEGRVQVIAGDLLKSGKSGIYDFFFDNDISKKSEAICGGSATVLVDGNPHIHKEVFHSLKESLAEGKPGVLVTIVTGKKVNNKKITRYWITEEIKKDLPSGFPELLLPKVLALLAPSKKENFLSLELQSPDEGNMLVLLEPLFPAPGLIIAGAGHIGKALCHLGKMLDFDVTVIDSREEFANRANLPDADHIIVDDVGEAIRKADKKGDTFIVIVTRGHDDDAKALLPALNSGAKYVGMIGSKSKIAKMKQNFIDNGWATEKDWSRIYAPVGIEIGSQTVEEIAVSIAAQLVLVRNS